MSLTLSPTAVVMLALALLLGLVGPPEPVAPKAESTALAAGDSYYVFLYRPGPAWRRGAPITAQPLEKHFAYMAELQRSKVLVMGGPFEDDAGAMGVVEAGSLEEAERIVRADPLVSDGVVTAEVHPWHASVPGCVESRPYEPRR